jgi:26S proteasome regulatory subunit T2
MGGPPDDGKDKDQNGKDVISLAATMIDML